MSYLDELMREKSEVTGAESFIASGQVTNTEIEAGSIAAGDIADNAVTADKLAASAFGNGIGGGAGTAIYADVDDSTLTNDVGGAGTLGIKALGITAAKLGATTKGSGIVAGAGTAFEVSDDNTTVEIDTNVVQLKDAGTAKAKLADDAKKHLVTVSLPAFTANSTVRVGLFACHTGKSYRLTKCELCTYTVPNDADGSCTFRLLNYDVDAATDDELVAAWNCENLVAKTGSQMTIIVAPADIELLGSTDYLYCELTNDSVAIDQNWGVASVTLELLEV